MTYRPSARTSFTTSFSCTTGGGGSSPSSPFSPPGGVGGTTSPKLEAPPTSLPVNANVISDLSVPYEALTL